VTVDRSRASSIEPAGSGSIDAGAPLADVDHVDDETWGAHAISDSISLSPSASRRLAEPGRARAFVLERIDDASCAIEAGGGRSIVLRDGLYGVVRTP
jgi:hypothetical protein